MESWLSLDLSSPAGTVAVHRILPHATPTLMREEVVGDQFHHSERLLGALDALLAAEGLRLADISRFVTTTGPGSFTGLRIAFATLKAFALAHGKPIETMGGSEARARAWAKAQPSLTVDEIFVFTHVSLDRFARARFVVHQANQLDFHGEALSTGIGLNPRGVGDGASVCLLDEKTPISLVPADSGIRAESFPLRARYLSESLTDAITRKTHSTPGEWIALSPEYFGSARFD